MSCQLRSLLSHSLVSGGFIFGSPKITDPLESRLAGYQLRATDSIVHNPSITQEMTTNQESRNNWQT